MAYTSRRSQNIVLQLVQSSDASEICLPHDVFYGMAPDGSGRLLDLDGNFYGLDRVAATLLQEALINSIGSAVLRVAKEFGAPLELVRSDALSFFDRLKSERLILERNQATQHARHDRFLKKWPLAVLLTAAARAPLPLRIRIVTLLTIAKVSFALLGWSRTVALWGGTAANVSDRQRGDPWILAESVRSLSAKHWVSTECKERALCCWTLLRLHGVPATLVVGVSLYPLKGHCWCTIDNHIVADDPSHCQGFAPVARYL